MSFSSLGKVTEKNHPFVGLVLIAIPDNFSTESVNGVYFNPKNPDMANFLNVSLSYFLHIVLRHDCDSLELSTYF